MIRLAFLLFCSYALVAVNTRACAHARYAWVAVTDLAIALLNFMAIRSVAEASGPGEAAGYALGGTAGGLFGVWISRRWNDRTQSGNVHTNATL